jgi:ubiquitin-conjugating enzyme E2 H
VLDLISHSISDLVNIFESFLPQLLRYPNPADPLNGEAAALHLDNLEKYNLRVRDHVAKHASSDIRPDGEDDRKISSETITTGATDRESDAKESQQDANDDGDDVDDGASDASNMSDL